MTVESTANPDSAPDAPTHRVTSQTERDRTAQAESPHGAGPLRDLRVIDISTVIAGPSCARYFADFGADVIKVERPPDGDSTRRMGFAHPETGESLSWRLWNRNKRVISLDLKTDAGRTALRRLVATADVLVENFRPGKLEALGLGPDELWKINPKLVVTRISGFGQDGPYAHRAGFATLAEAMAGWAAISGEPGGAPLLPPIPLTDELCGLAAAFASMVALHAGVGQVVDANLLESLLQVMGPMVTAFVAGGFRQGRMGSALPHSCPRGAWPAADGRWVAISTSTDSVAERVMRLVGLGGDSRFDSLAGRQANRAEVDAAVARFVAAAPATEIIAAFEAADAAAAIVYDVDDLIADEHVVERGVLVEVDGLVMQNVVARLSETPGAVRWTGRPFDADTEQVLADLEP